MYINRAEIKIEYNPCYILEPTKWARQANEVSEEFRKRLHIKHEVQSKKRIKGGKSQKKQSTPMMINKIPAMYDTLFRLISLIINLPK